MTVGIVGSSFYNTEQDATLTIGESMNIGRYTLTYDDLNIYQTQSKRVVSATMSVRNEGKLISQLVPEKYFHQSYEQPVTEVAIHGNLAEDLYIILVDSEASSGLSDFKVLINPVVNWIWIGGLVLVLGGLISFWPERQRATISEQTGPGRS
jgi:cytochrome c-type biogenesis protein CcmF